MLLKIFIILTGMHHLPGFCANALRASCGRFEEYLKCGPSCPYTCDTLEENICCKAVCNPGCFCRDGYILEKKSSSNKCVLIENCPKPGVLSFQTKIIYVLEISRTVRITVTRINGSSGEITVHWRTREGTAKKLIHFIGEGGLLYFANGVTTQTIEILIIDNNIRESDRIFYVDILNPTNKATLISGTNFETCTVTIEDDDMEPGYLEMADLSIVVPENVSRTNLKVLRIGGKDGLLTVNFRTISRTAQSNFDFAPLTGELVFREGEIMKTVSVAIFNDNIKEENEIFEVEIYNPKAGPGVKNFRPQGKKTSTLITIIDDDIRAGCVETGKSSITVLESIGQVILPVVRKGGSDGKLTVEYTTVDGSARAPTDYLPASGLLFFQDGEILKTITLIIVNDNILEPNESFQVKLKNSMNAVGVTDRALLGSVTSTLIEIIDDDFKAGSIEMEKPSISVPESTGEVILRVVRRGGSDGKLTVEYTTVDGSARAPTDYLPASGLLIFQDGETLKTITLIIVNDNILEPNESFQVKLRNSKNAAGNIEADLLGPTTSSLIEIVDDDFKAGSIEMGKQSIKVPESTGQVIVPVVRRGGSDGKLTVEYTTVDGSARAPTDYLPASGLLVFQDGETLKTITLIIVNDNILETNESFQVKLRNSINAMGVTDRGLLGSVTSTLIEIVDDDFKAGCIEMGKPSISVPESTGQVILPVVRRGGSDGKLTVEYTTVDGSASSRTDYLPVSGLLVFQDGETLKTITLIIVNDNILEPNESFQVKLSNSMNAMGVTDRGLLGSATSTLIEIVDDDFKTGCIEMGKISITVTESTGQVILPVVRKGGSDGKLTVEYTTVDGSARAPTDYLPASGLLFFQDGEILKTITLIIVNDKILEPNESFQVKLRNSKNAAGNIDRGLLGPVASTLIEIVDDDSNPTPLLERNIEFSFRTTNIRVRENAGVVRFHIKRTGDSSIPVSIFLLTRDGTAKGGEDYRRTRGTISFASDDIELTLQINLVDDDKPEHDETFQVLLSKPSAGAIIPGRDILTITIEDDDNQANRTQVENTSVQTVHQNIQQPLSESYFIASAVSQGNSQVSAQISSSQHILSKPTSLEGSSQSNSQLDKISQSSTLTSSSSHVSFPKLNVAGQAISQVSKSGDYSETSFQLSSSQLPKLAPSEGIISQTGSQSVSSSQIQSQQSSSHLLVSKPHLLGEVTSQLSSQAQSGSQVVDISQASSQMISSLQSSSSSQMGSSSQMSSSSQSSSSLQISSSSQTSSSSHHLQGTISQASSASGGFSEISLQQSSSHSLSKPSSSEVAPQPGSELLLNSNECAPGLIYKECAPSCPKTCQNMNIKQSPCAAKGCLRGCHCPEGYVKEHASSNSCILPQQCKN